MPYYGKLYMKDANGNVAQIVPEAYSSATQYVGATASANGTTGTVPPAQISQRNWFLGGDAELLELLYLVLVPQGKSTMFNLVLTNGGSKTITWPASVKWSAGAPPALTESGVDVLTFLTADGGTTWYGTLAVKGAA